MDIHPIDRVALIDYSTGADRMATEVFRDAEEGTGHYCLICPSYKLLETDEVRRAHTHSRCHQGNIKHYGDSIGELTSYDSDNRLIAIAKFLSRDVDACEGSVGADAFYAVVGKYILGSASLERLMFTFARISTRVTGEAENVRGMCAVCWTRPCCVLFVTCKHVAVCTECSEGCDSCPICRADIEVREHVFVT
jgi:hypothetical protein